jgi:hypothetical protein
VILSVWITSRISVEIVFKPTFNTNHMNKTLNRVERFLHTVNDTLNEQFSKAMIRRLISNESDVDRVYIEFMGAYNHKDATSHEIQIKAEIIFTHTDDTTGAEIINSTRPSTSEDCRNLFSDLVICRNPKSFNPVFETDGNGTYTLKYSRGKEFQRDLYICFSFSSDSVLTYSISTMPNPIREMIKELISNESDTDKIYSEFTRAYEEKTKNTHVIPIKEKFTLTPNDSAADNETTTYQLTPKKCHNFFDRLVKCVNPWSPNAVYEEAGYRTYSIKYSNGAGNLYIYFSIGWYHDLSYWVSTTPTQLHDMGNR